MHLVSWTQQYPAIIPRDFKDRVSQKQPLANLGINEHYLLDYNRPASWFRTANVIANLNPALVVIQWSIALQGLPLATVVKLLRAKGIEVFFDLHFVLQKEASLLDGFLSRYALSKADAFIVHSHKTTLELAELLPAKTLVIMTCNAPAKTGHSKVIELYHPVYDLFTPKANFDIEAYKQQHGLRQHVFLFFGFIRKYKGLHFCLEAFARLAQERNDVSLLIVGESFWKTLDQSKLSTRIKNMLFGLAKTIMRPSGQDESNYNPLSLIETYNLQDKVKVVNTFVADEQVYQYFQAADALLLFYEYATPSGVESMAYNFKKPILATAVGHFPETIKDGLNGYLAIPANVDSMANAMRTFLKHPINPDNVDMQAKNWTWANYARAIQGG